MAKVQLEMKLTRTVGNNKNIFFANILLAKGSAKITS